jgi:pimeloyl-ACP methyl ester carboxylesterase
MSNIRNLPAAHSAVTSANDTRLYVERRGCGDPLLLIHGGGEDAGMMRRQAEAFVDAGFAVVTYDRRGTGRSGRDAWPGAGAPQHSDDAAALLVALGLAGVVVVGVSSGGVIALDLAARHPERLAHVIAWEPPAAGILPGGADAAAAIMEPVNAHLAGHPGDYVGAQALLLTAIVGFPVTFDDPAFATARVNAEPMIRDEPTITLADLPPAAVEVTIGIGSEPNDLVRAAVAELGRRLERPPAMVDGPHEVYLSDPPALAGLVTTAVGR